MKFKELLHYPLVWLFALFVMGFFLADLILPDRARSEFENTKLQQKPDFTIASFLDSSYSTTYEKYINDQFPARDQWITLKAVTEIGLGKVENNNIIYGKDGYLFEKLQIIPEPNSNAGMNTANRVQIDRNKKWMNEFLQKYDLPITFAIAPNSYAVMQDKMYVGLDSMPNQEKMIPEIYSEFTPNQNITYLNFLDTLRSHQDEYIYYRTDHHWTTLGAYYAYRDYCEAKGLTPVSLDALKGNEVEGFYGSYYNKCKKPGAISDTITWYDVPVDSYQFVTDVRDEKLNAQGEVTKWNEIPMLKVNSLYQMGQFDTRDKYAAFMWGNSGLAQIVSGHNADKKDKPTRLLIIKDSFANSMIPFLTYNYDEIWVIDPRSIPMNMSKILSENEFDDIFVLYNFTSFLTDTYIARLKF